MKTVLQNVGYDCQKCLFSFECKINVVLYIWNTNNNSSALPLYCSVVLTVWQCDVSRQNKKQKF